MRILYTHNTYQHVGGEDSVVDTEMSILRKHGHHVEIYNRNNKDINAQNAFLVAKQAFWSKKTQKDLEKIIKNFKPDVIHSHNTFPLISPSLYWTANYFQIPIVQTLHNFRLICLNALFLRDGHVCEDCIRSVPWKGVVRACYRDSRAASATLAGMLALHRGLGTYRLKVSRYIALNEFCRKKFITAGLPAEKIVVKPNFVDWDQVIPSHSRFQENNKKHFLFVGRLSAEKGVHTLAKAFDRVPGAKLRVAGNGPEEEIFTGMTGVTALGSLPIDSVRLEMTNATALVLPSICYENFPRTIVEAYASGLPVIASRIGALANIVHEGETGLLFTPGDAHDLAEKIIWACAHPEEMRRMGIAARQKYERFYTPEQNYLKLMDIYHEAIAEDKGHDS